MTTPLLDLCRAAGLSTGARLTPRLEMDLRLICQHIAIVRDLMAMRRQGLFESVHCHAEVLGIVLPGEPARAVRRIYWEEAGRIVQAWRDRLGTSIERTPAKKSAAKLPTRRKSAAP
ncbi:MAG TPA: hypothetical protein VN841_02525 [Bryobacteraceae bacterium]|nr:hypothetical protein [Bryobacteraceae bacterium]